MAFRAVLSSSIASGLLYSVFSFESWFMAMVLFDGSILFLLSLSENCLGKCSLLLLLVKVELSKLAFCLLVIAVL